jgi:hypothetical protein
MASKDAMYDAKMAAKAAANANTIKQVGPSGGLNAGVIAGANAPTSYSKKETTPSTSVASVGPLGGLAAGVVAGVNYNPAGAPEPETKKWVKAGTVQTQSGPVDVDENGKAVDGSTPIAVTGSEGGDEGGDGGGNNVEITLVDTKLDDYGNTIGIYSDGSTKVLIQSGNKYRSTIDEDAYSILKKTLEDYDLGEFVSVIQGYMDRGIGSEQATLEIRKDPIYTKRFQGNENRKKAGLNAISEAAYLALENSYSETLKAYGLATQFGTDRKVRQAAMAEIIGGDVSADEFKNRIDTVVTRVKNADPTIKATMAGFFNIKDEDLISYFISPKENLPKLQEKVTAAEIGAAAKGQDLKTSVEAATALAQFGVDREEALTGYQAIGEVLPTASKLGDIYGDKYTQETAEQEVFKGLASAKRKRQQLAEREVATFAGSSGRLRTGRAEGNAGRF